MTAKWSDLLNGATVFRNHGQFAARSGVKTMLPCQQLGADLRDFQTNVGLHSRHRGTGFKNFQKLKIVKNRKSYTS